MKYRKKPVEVEAIKLDDSINPSEAAEWCGGKVCGVGAVGEKMWIEIETLEGVMKAQFGDYIIRGVQGEHYPCKPDIFEQTYEVCEEPTEEGSKK